MSAVLASAPNSDTAPYIQELLLDPILKKASYLGLARLLPYISVRTFRSGERLYQAGKPADEFFYLLQGEVKLVSSAQQSISLNSRRIGEEAATDFDHYFGDAIAQSDVRTLVISRKNLASLSGSTPNLKAEFYYSLMQTFAGDRMPQPKNVEPAKAPLSALVKKSEAVTLILGWVLTFLAPAIVLMFGGKWGLDRPTTYFLAIFSSTMFMWIFTLVDEYIPGIFALLATLAMGLVPTPVILSGLASDGFLLAMSVLGLGAVIVSSGLSYRILLLLLKKLPNTPFWQNTALMGIGFVLTPLIPSINGRVALVSPFLNDMVEILHHKPKSAAANKLAVSAFTGVSLMSGVFLSSKSVNFVVFGLLPEQMQDQFQWLDWFVASAVAGLALLVFHSITTRIMLRGKEAAEPAALSEEQLSIQLSLLGPLKGGEWAAIIGVALFMVGVVTASFHKVSSPGLGMAILFGMLLFGVLDKKQFREKIDWPFLMYLGGIVGITSAINYLGLAKVMASHLGWLGEYMHSNFGLFVLLLCGVIFLIRLAVPISATIVISATVLMPVAGHFGVNPWVVGFIILIVGEMWFFPYQCSYYLQFKELSKNKIYDEAAFLKFNTVANFMKIAAIYASIPYWKGAGLL